jgi:hypothetical protein
VIGTVLGAQLTFGLVAKPIAETLTSADFHSESVTNCSASGAVRPVTNALTADVPPPDEGSAPQWACSDTLLEHRRSRGPYDRESPDRQVGGYARRLMCLPV